MDWYSDAAIQAVELYAHRPALQPRVAWEFATRRIFGKGTSSQVKSCPRGAFLGLCEAGLVRGIPAGRYTTSRKNKQYAVEAVNLLLRFPHLADDPLGLWATVIRGKFKTHNSQMSVVIALWKRGFINPASTEA